MATPLLARLIRFGGGKLLDSAVARVVPVGKVAGSGLAKGLTGAALARLATRSVPGAIVVGGGLLAKMLYDRRHAKPSAPAPEMRESQPNDDDADVLG